MINLTERTAVNKANGWEQECYLSLLVVFRFQTEDTVFNPTNYEF